MINLTKYSDLNATLSYQPSPDSRKRGEINHPNVQCLSSSYLDHLDDPDDPDDPDDEGPPPPRPPPPRPINQCPEQCEDDPSTTVPTTARIFGGSFCDEEGLSARDWSLQCFVNNDTDLHPHNLFRCHGQCQRGELCFERQTIHNFIDAFCVSNWPSTRMQSHEGNPFAHFMSIGYVRRGFVHLVLTRLDSDDAPFNAVEFHTTAFDAQYNAIADIDHCTGCSSLQFNWNPGWTYIMAWVMASDIGEDVKLNMYIFDNS